MKHDLMLHPNTCTTSNSMTCQAATEIYRWLPPFPPVGTQATHTRTIPEGGIFCTLVILTALLNPSRHHFFCLVLLGKPKRFGDGQIALVFWRLLQLPLCLPLRVE